MPSRPLTRLLWVVGGLLVAYATVALLAWALQERIVFSGPRSYLPDPAQRGLADARLVEVMSEDSVRLWGWYLPPRPAPQQRAPGLLWFPGNNETVASLAPLIRELRPASVGVLILDYRGSGESRGKASEEGMYRDAEAAWGFLAARPEIDRSRIGAYGRSIGTVAALHVALNRRVRAVILHAPFTSARDLFGLHYWYLPPFVLRLELDNLDRARRLRAPLLVFHGVDDRTVPVAMGRAVAQAGRAREFVTLAEGGHSDVHEVAGDRYREKFQGFLSAVFDY